jgi:hypothetical protein
VFGQGGLLDAAEGTFEDLALLASGKGGVQNVLGAVQTAGTAFQTFKGKDIRSIVNQEARQASRDILRAQLPGAVRLAVNSTNGMLFPKPPTGSGEVGTPRGNTQT